MKFEDDERRAHGKYKINQGTNKFFNMQNNRARSY